MATITRRRRSSEDEEERDDRPVRGRRRDEDEDDRPTRGRRRSTSKDEDEDSDDRPTRGRGRRSRDEDEDDRPARRGRGSRSSREDSDDRPSSRSRGRASGGFSSYSQKRKANSKFADEFKPEKNEPTLIKFLDAEPFDVYNQHWINEVPSGTRKSYMCRDDEYFEADRDFDKGCPLDDIGDTPSTFALFNILDLTNPRKPEVKVWKCSVTVADILERLASNDRTSPLNREDVYFEVTMVKGKNKVTWQIEAVKSRDLEEDFDIEPFTADELEDFEADRFEDRTVVQKADSYDDLYELAGSLD